MRPASTALAFAPDEVVPLKVPFAAALDMIPAHALKVPFTPSSPSSSSLRSISHASPLNPGSHVHANARSFTGSTSHVPRLLQTVDLESSTPGHAADVQLSSGNPNPGAHATQ